MRILQICLKPPYPKVDGGCIAIAAMTECLLMANHNLRVLCMSTHKHPFVPSKVPTDILERTKMEGIEVDTRIKPVDALANLFSSSSYNIERFYSKKFEQRIVEILSEETFDIIHFESIYCTPYLDTISKHSKAKVVLRCHNIEFKIWEHLALEERNPLKKWYLLLLANRLRQYESDILQKVDAIVPISKEDQNGLRQLGVKVPSEVIPIGMNVNVVKHSAMATDQISLYHLGAMDWAPNMEAIEWFLNEIWPKISTQFPEVLCSLAGRKMPSKILSRSTRRLHIQGEIENAMDFISDKNVAIIPLLSGSGMRVKIVEALALGKVVITTNLGATGIPIEDGKNILIANTSDEMLDKISLLIKNPERIASIGLEARKLAEREFDLNKLSSKLTYFYDKL